MLSACCPGLGLGVKGVGFWVDISPKNKLEKGMEICKACM